MSCPFANIFGAPGTGVHSIRVFNIAIVDVIFTFIFAYIINYFVKGNYYQVLLFLFILGIILHRLFCVNTTVDQIIFGKK